MGDTNEAQLTRLLTSRRWGVDTPAGFAALNGQQQGRLLEILRELRQQPDGHLIWMGLGPALRFLDPVRADGSMGPHQTRARGRYIIRMPSRADIAFVDVGPDGPALCTHVDDPQRDHGAAPCWHKYLLEVSLLGDEPPPPA